MARRAFVTGWPVKHSRSPLVHTHWLRLHGIEGAYVKHPVETQDFSAFLRDLDAAGFVGGNVTIPHKEAAHDLCDFRDAAADQLGAVNTVWLEDGKLHGANTDGIGFLANLDDRAPHWRAQAPERTALVLGAGGAARAVIAALVSAGFRDVVIANRTVERATDLATRFGPSCRAVPLADAGKEMATATFVVNTTSLGMDGNDDLPVTFDESPAGTIITDIVYTPLTTPFLKAARDAGLETVDGLGMLLHQAVPGFEKWFGVRPKVSRALRAMVERNLGERNAPVIIGLTGSIGMGKSTTATMFREAGIPVFDSDATVHALYEGEAVAPVEAAFPGSTRDGKIDRTLLSPMVIGNEAAMKRLEAIVHPMVRAAERAFFENVSAQGHAIAVLDAPLLFEMDNAEKADAIVVVSAPADVQRERVLARPGMTEEKLAAILARQVPDAEKRARADHVIDSSLGLEAARAQVERIVAIYTPVSDEEHENA